jgi:plastocyanin
MTWLSRICFSLCWLLPALAGSVTGTVELVKSRDPEVRNHRKFSGVVVWLEPTGKTVGAPPDARALAVMSQKGKAFTPHVLAIPAGASVDFPNFDPIFHNAFSSYSGQVFDVGLYPPGRSRTVTFKREGVVRVFCNIHSTMSAVIVVLNTPYFAVSDDSGNFTIADVPAGEYRLRVYHERALPQTLKALEQFVKVSGEGLQVQPLVISETGYVQTPHQNKYGMDYPATDDQITYSRDRK